MSGIDKLPVAVDALGGDNAPEQVVQGAVDSGIACVLVGDEAKVAPFLAAHNNPDRITIHHTTEHILMDEHPITAIRNKKDSSLMVGISLVKQGKALGCMSAGNTGAFMMGSTMVLGRMAGITRPAAAIPIPTPEGNTLLLDAGAATDCTAADLVNFAVCGHTYARQLWNVEKPRIALLSIGEEESKGSKQARTAHKLLKESDLNFIGNVQGTDIGRSVCDVMVCDGFTGNVALKVAEGMAMLIMQIVKDELGSAAGMEKLAALMLRPLMRRIKKRLDWQEVGGGPMLGIAGNVVIAHGKSRHKAVASAIRLTYDLARTNLLSELELALKTHHDMSQAAEQMNGVSV